MGTGISSEVFHIVGDLCSEIQRLKIFVKGIASWFEQVRNNFVLILSGPCALLGFNELKILHVPLKSKRVRHH